MASKHKKKVERSKASVRLEIVRAIKIQNIPISILRVDKDTPLPEYDASCGWNSPSY